MAFDIGVSKHPFGVKIRQLRDARRLSMERLGSMARVSPSTILRIEVESVKKIRPGTLEQVIVALNEAEPLTEKDIDQILDLASFNHAQSRGIKFRLMSKVFSEASDRADQRAQQTIDCIQMVYRLIALVGLKRTQDLLKNLLSGFEVDGPAPEAVYISASKTMNSTDDRGFDIPPGAIAYPVSAPPGMKATIVQPASMPVQRPRRDDKVG